MGRFDCKSVFLYVNVSQILISFKSGMGESKYELSTSVHNGIFVCCPLTNLFPVRLPRILADSVIPGTKYLLQACSELSILRMCTYRPIIWMLHMFDSFIHFRKPS